MSQNFLATRFTCSWPWSTLVLLCDGRIVCGCADPLGRRVLGDARGQTVHEIWTGPVISSLRQGLNRGGSAFCGDCPLKRPVQADAPVPQRSLDVSPLPSRLYVEPTSACNLSCYQSCCAPETGIARTRQASMLDFDLFHRVIDETGPSLVRLDFFNYGEAFLHKRAVEMCEYVKARFPHVYLYTSTNGLAFTEESLRRLARSGIDEVTFSVDGASQDTYATYRRRGDFSAVLRNMRLMADEKRAADLDVPVINWRYILFTWNDSDEEMARARELASEIGIDRLSWEITDHPEDAFSRRFLPGTPDYAAIQREIWDDNNLGNAILGATPRARIEVLSLVPRFPVLTRPGRLFKVRTRIWNRSSRPFAATASYGRRLVRLGAQLWSANRVLLDRDYARAWFPGNVPAGGHLDVSIEMKAPSAPGRYNLKFDLVSEGIDWFEACGSETTTRRLWVR
jgi:hypothetical protein